MSYYIMIPSHTSYNYPSQSRNTLKYTFARNHMHLYRIPSEQTILLITIPILLLVTFTPEMYLTAMPSREPSNFNTLETRAEPGMDEYHRFAIFDYPIFSTMRCTWETLSSSKISNASYNPVRLMHESRRQWWHVTWRSVILKEVLSSAFAPWKYNEVPFHRNSH